MFRARRKQSTLGRGGALFSIAVQVTSRDLDVLSVAETERLYLKPEDVDTTPSPAADVPACGTNQRG